MGNLFEERTLMESIISNADFGTLIPTVSFDELHLQPKGKGEAGLVDL